MKQLLNNVLITLLLFILPLSAGAQIKTYLDYNEKPTRKESAIYVRLYTPDKDDLYKVEQYYADNGHEIFSGHCTSKKKESRTGHFYFFQNGLVSSDGFYANNKKTGEWISYFDSSDITSAISVYSNTDSLVTVTKYFQNGKIESKYAHNDKRFVGEFIEYDSLGNLKCRENYNDPQNVTVTVYYSNGKIRVNEIDDYHGAPISGKSYDTLGNEITFTPYRIMPKPAYSLNDYFQKHIVYPDPAREANLTGRVLITFHVNENGKITDAKVTGHLTDILDREALRAIREMPDWQPGMSNGKPVKVLFTQPVTFSLQ